MKVRAATKLLGVVYSLVDPRTYAHVLRLLHYYSYTHARERGKIAKGRGVGFPPNISIANGERISIGAHSKIGARTSLWAGDSHGRIVIGVDCRLAPECFLTASEYGIQPEENIVDQPRREADIILGNDVWLGARVFVTAGVTIGDGCVVGAGAVVTQSLPPGSIAVGVPARIIGNRADLAASPEPIRTQWSSTSQS
jgi:acetyltransferase-like isoleucine patch superfamily enzyme